MQLKTDRIKGKKKGQNKRKNVVKIQAPFKFLNRCVNVRFQSDWYLSIFLYLNLEEDLQRWGFYI